MTRPLAIDLFCGLGGWTDGLLAEDYRVIGFDITRHVYGEHRYPAQLVIQDVTTLHGSQFRTADLIVASPPCQEYSYMAMPWSLAKAKAAAIRADTSGAELERLNRLFDSCFRIQREACEAAGRHIPMLVENVRGAQPWVGRARWSFGSFFLWGDVPALMPVIGRRHTKNNGGSWFNIAHNTTSGKANNPVSIPANGIKQGGDWFNASQPSMSRLYGSKSPQAQDGIRHDREDSAAAVPLHRRDVPPSNREGSGMSDLGTTTKPLNAHVWEREANEHYVEPAWCSKRLFEEEEFLGGIYDPCCGFGTIVKEALKQGHAAYGSDLVDRGWDSTRTPHDFLTSPVENHQNIVCNPPFNIAEAFAKAALARAERKVAMIFPVARLNAAHWLRGTPLARVWLMTPRPSMPPRHTITAGQKPGGGKMDYCWLLWSKGRLGPADLRWLRRDGEPA